MFPVVIDARCTMKQELLFTVLLSLWGVADSQLWGVWTSVKNTFGYETCSDVWIPGRVGGNMIITFVVK